MSKIELELIGSDPEMFIVEKNTPVSAIGLVPGSKESPYMISEHESVQVDNVAIEFNVKPSKTPKEFFDSFTKCYEWMDSHLKKINTDLGILISPSVVFDESQLRTREAKMFGCEPDFDAWEESVNNPPSSETLMRSCGGHIHLGLKNFDDLDPFRLIRVLDSTVGIYCSSICGDTERVKLYGKAGAFRIKKYGVEYRTPSNSWLKSYESVERVFELVQEAVDKYNDGEDASYDVQMAINLPDFDVSNWVTVENQ